MKKTSIIILAIFAVIGGGFLIGGASLQSSAHDSYNMVEGEKEGHIIIKILIAEMMIILLLPFHNQEVNMNYTN